MNLFEINDKNIFYWQGTIRSCFGDDFRSMWKHDLLIKDLEKTKIEIYKCNRTDINVFETIARHRYNEIKVYGSSYNYIYTNRCSFIEIKTINYNVARFEIADEWTFEEETVFTDICEKYFANILTLISERKAILAEEDKCEGNNAIKLFAACAILCSIVTTIALIINHLQ